VCSQRPFSTRGLAGVAHPSIGASRFILAATRHLHFGIVREREQEKSTVKSVTQLSALATGKCTQRTHLAGILLALAEPQLLLGTALYDDQVMNASPIFSRAHIGVRCAHRASVAKPWSSYGEQST